MRIARCVRHDIVLIQNVQTQIAVKTGFFCILGAELLDFLDAFGKNGESE